MSYLATLEARVAELEAQRDYHKRQRAAWKNTPERYADHDRAVRAREEDLVAARRELAAERDAPFVAVAR